ncbi:MAG: DUF896 domain-containing protein [Bacillota bacterium]|nr:DUF896 domain-containing protein [Bacillota bacterium]
MDRDKIDNVIKRINELSKKSKTEGLTDDEKIEQQNLRKEYINAFKSNLKSSLDSIRVVDKHGNKLPLKQKNAEKFSN